MALYMARIQLHPSTGKNYDQLHAFLRDWGGSKYIIDTEAFSWELPTGYYIIDPQIDVQSKDITEALYRELRQAGFWSLVVVSKSDDTTFILPWKG